VDRFSGLLLRRATSWPSNRDVPPYCPAVVGPGLPRGPQPVGASLEPRTRDRIQNGLRPGMKDLTEVLPGVGGVGLPEPDGVSKGELDPLLKRQRPADRSVRLTSRYSATGW
jgi:hypothetical protein